MRHSKNIVIIAIGASAVLITAGIYYIQTKRLNKKKDQQKAAKEKENLAKNTIKQNSEDLVEKLKKEGNNHFKDGRIKEAITCYSKGIKINPEKKELFVNRAMAYIKLHDYKQALADTDKIILLDPLYAKGHQLQGVCLLRCDELQQARVRLERALEIDPKNASAAARLEECNARIHENAQLSSPTSPAEFMTNLNNFLLGANSPKAAQHPEQGQRNPFSGEGESVRDGGFVDLVDKAEPLATYGEEAASRDKDGLVTGSGEHEVESNLNDFFGWPQKDVCESPLIKDNSAAEEGGKKPDENPGAKEEEDKEEREEEREVANSSEAAQKNKESWVKEEEEQPREVENKGEELTARQKGDVEQSLEEEVNKYENDNEDADMEESSGGVDTEEKNEGGPYKSDGDWEAAENNDDENYAEDVSEEDERDGAERKNESEMGVEKKRQQEDEQSE